MLEISLNQFDVIYYKFGQAEPRKVNLDPKRTASVEVGEIYRTASALSIYLDDMETRPQLKRLISMPSLSDPQGLLKANDISSNFEVPHLDAGHHKNLASTMLNLTSHADLHEM